MKLTNNLAQSIRLGVEDAKLDLAVGSDCHEHEPAQPLLLGFDGFTGMATAGQLRKPTGATWNIMGRLRDESTAQSRGR